MRNMIAALLVALLSTRAYADPPKYTRKPTLDFGSTRASAHPRKQVARDTPSPKPLSADDILATRRAIDPIRQEQEGILVKLVADTPDSDPEKPDLLFRLAEHYASELRLWRLTAVERSLHSGY
jgi:hypothetical protein